LNTRELLRDLAFALILLITGSCRPPIGSQGSAPAEAAGRLKIVSSQPPNLSANKFSNFYPPPRSAFNYIYTNITGLPKASCVPKVRAPILEILSQDFSHVIFRFKGGSCKKALWLRYYSFEILVGHQRIQVFCRRHQMYQMPQERNSSKYGL
jgi:hypothetical protein